MAAAEEPTIHLRFRIKYDTVYGESLIFESNIPQLDEPKGKATVSNPSLSELPLHNMAYAAGGLWSLDIDVPQSVVANGFTYRYVFVKDGLAQYEGVPRKYKLTEAASFLKFIEFKDFWRSMGDVTTIFHTSIFKGTIFRRDVSSIQAARKVVARGKITAWVRLKIDGARVPADCDLRVCGSLDAMGKWDVTKALPLSCDGTFPFWRVDLLLAADEFPFEYKYVLAKTDGSSAIWEDGFNRIVSAADGKDVQVDAITASPNVAPTSEQQLTKMVESSLSVSDKKATPSGTTELDVVEKKAPVAEAPASTPDPCGKPAEVVPVKLLAVTDEPPRYPSPWRGVGVAIPVFSLRSKNGLGVGEFLDLKLMGDWASSVGVKLIQLLPVNDTTVGMTWRDSSPYTAVSVFALHPLYLNVDAIGDIPPEVQESLAKAKEELNKEKEVKYEASMNTKLELVREIFLAQKEKFLSSPEFLEWFAANKHWVLPYSVFCIFRNLTGTSEFSRWGLRDNMSLEQMEEFAKPKTFHYDAICYNYFVQYHLHKQLSEAAEYCRAKGVGIKGDLPIGVNKWCVDTWVYREEFRMHVQAGAPPDAFSNTGQNWQFPTYNWDLMSKNGYKWWRARLKVLAQYFEAYRIDHVLGFFRIWELSDSCSYGLLGQFRPAVPIRRGELEAKGVGRGHEMARLIEPYVRKHLLERLFGARAQEVADKYFICTNNNDRTWFKFKPECDTERKIEGLLWDREKLKTEAEKTWFDTLRKGLFELVQNVILLVDAEEKDAYHFRIKMMDTSSFQEFVGNDQGKRKFLMDLYHDYFWVRQDTEWRRRALEKLPMMREASDMLVCGEDLGMVPRCVEGVLSELSILRLRIQRMPPETDREFGDTKTYPYLCVCSPSSHDMAPIRVWWTESAEKTKRFYNNVLGLTGEVPKECTQEIATKIIRLHLDSPAIWAIFPIQDLFSLGDDKIRRMPAAEEQINDPGNPQNCWSYRMHIPLEELLSKSEFNTTVKQQIKESGRLEVDS